MCLFSAAPSAAPNVTQTLATSYSITINWEQVPCEHMNGDITGYSVRYGEMGTNTTVLNITGVSVTEATISEPVYYLLNSSCSSQQSWYWSVR